MTKEFNNVVNFNLKLCKNSKEKGIFCVTNLEKVSKYLQIVKKSGKQLILVDEREAWK